MTAGLLDDLVARGLVHDSTDRDALGARLSAKPIGVYVGFDPTADSLHVGHLLGQLVLRRFQLAGHRPVALAGGATGMVGDPSGKSDERNLLDRETLAANVASIKGQLERILDFEPGPCAARLVDNADWTATISVLDFLRDVGKHVTVNQMLAKESVKSRLGGESGLSFTEFSYMLLQANDFRHLCAVADVEMQAGGSDQWGNITAGIDLIRRTQSRQAFGLTWPLVTKSDGTKFGKTSSGAVWLDPLKTSPYQFRQFWFQSADDDAERFLAMYSLAGIGEINELLEQHRGQPGKRLAQRRLAVEMTTLVHGKEASADAEAAADVLFGGDPGASSERALEIVGREAPSSTVSCGALDDVPSLLVSCGLASSTSEARRTLDQGGVRVNGGPVAAGDTLSDVRRLHGRWLLLRKGKSSYHLLEVRSE